MKCSDVELLLPDFVINKLSNGQYSNVQSHVAACVHCQQTAKEYHHLLLGIQEMKTEEPSEQYFASILPRVHQRIESKRQGFRIPEYLIRFALPVALTVVLVMLIINYQPANNNQTQARIETTEQETTSDDLSDILGLTVDETAENISQEDKSIIAEILSDVTESIPMTEEITDSLIQSMNPNDALQLFAMLEQPTDSDQR